MPKVKAHLDFEKQAQILNIKLHTVSSLPAGWAGGIVYLTTDNKVYWHNGTAWIPINDTSNLIVNVTAGGGITVAVTSGVAKVTLDPDGSTLELSGVGDDAKARIKDAGVTTAKIADSAVETAKIANGAVQTAKIADSNVTTAKIADSNVTAVKLATDSVTTIKVVDKNITFAKIQDVPTMTVIGRIAGGAGVSSAITILTDLNAIISAHDSLASAKAVKDYVDGVVGGLGTLKGGLDAAAATSFPSGANKGDYWYVTVAGTIQTVNFNVGDVMIANKNGASTTLATDWIFLEVNRDQATTSVLGVVSLATQAEARAMSSTTKALTPSNLGDVKATDAETQTGTATDRFITPANLSARSATESRSGIAPLATQAEANAGTNDTKVITPLKLKVYAEALVAAHGRFAGDVGNGSATSIVCTHNFNTRDVIVEVWDNVAWETVICDVARTSVNAVTLGFAVAPTTNQYRVNIRR